MVDYQKGFGTEESPTWSTQAARDSAPVPSYLTDDNAPLIPDTNITPEYYTSYDYHRKEVEHVWKKCWQPTCREEEIPNVGDYFKYDVAGLSFIVVRTGPEEFKAYWNICRHRGRQLVDHSGECKAQFKCPYHSWTWNIDGSLAYYPGAWDFPNVSKETHGLPEVQVGRWGGFVFINPDLNGGTLEDHIGGMAKHFADWPLDRRFGLWHVRKTINSNWKIALEAFLEAYHVVQTHPQALPSNAEHGSKYDYWDEGAAAYSRLITPNATPSVHQRGGSLREALAVAWLLCNGFRLEDAGKLPDTITDRASLAAWRRQNLKETTGADYSSQCDAMILDSIQYWSMPGFAPWMGEGLPLAYNFRPNADSPETSYMDVWMLVRVPDEGPRPAPGKLIELGSDEPFEPHIGAIGNIFDQDDFNMPRVQEGLRSWPEAIGPIVTAQYQESRIRFLHQMIEKRINTGG